MIRNTDIFGDYSAGFGPDMGQIGLYIHFPWCEKKCPYCDFNSHAAAKAVPESEYIQALITDLEQYRSLLGQRQIRSIYLGGGTPSLFSPRQLGRLLELIADLSNIEGKVEITMEANPGTVNGENLKAYRAAGINRLSLGIQSFNNSQLCALGRIHNGTQAGSAFNRAREAGFNNINIDLMFGLPEQTEAEAMEDIRTALTLEPDHLSVYQLTIEPNTLFYHHPPVLPSDEHIYTMQLGLQENIGQAAYKQYEVSAYSKPGKQCRHNLNYWQFGDYLGIGAGAHSKISTDAGVYRFSKERHPDRYMMCSATTGATRDLKCLDKNDLITEFMLNALRLNSGFNQTMFEQHTALSLAQCHQALDLAQEKGLLKHKEDRYYPSQQGRWFLNDLIQIFMDAA